MSDLVPLISVVITTCKRNYKTLARAVNSAFLQDYPNIEIIVVDDSPSTFSEREIIKNKITQSFPVVNYFQHKTNLGACEARNTGLRLSNGEYIAFLDDDDEWMPEKLSKTFSGFISDKVGLVYCNYLKIDSLGNESYQHPKIPYKGNVFSDLIKSNFIGSTSIPLIRRECIVSLGGFDSEMESAQDCDMWLRISQNYEINFINEYLVKYHSHNGDRISNNPKKKIQGLERLIEKNLEYLSKNRNAMWLRKIKITPYYSAFYGFQTGLQKWMEAVLLNPFNIAVNTKYLVSLINARRR